MYFLQFRLYSCYYLGKQLEYVPFSIDKETNVCCLNLIFVANTLVLRTWHLTSNTMVLLFKKVLAVGWTLKVLSRGNVLMNE